MIDSKGRNIDYLRISVTDRCNLRCVYCMPESGVPPLAHSQIMRFEEILRICRIMGGLGIKKLKITGGEPLVRQGVPAFIAAAKNISGIEQVTLTTNGILLVRYLRELLQAGIDGINISLDTLDTDCYRKIVRTGELAQALSGLAAAWKEGIRPLKINCVLMHGINDREVVKLAALAKDREISVRFIELMPIGLGTFFTPVTGAEVLRQLTAVYGKAKPCNTVIGNGPAAYYTFPGLRGQIGFIDAISHCFCPTCNRLRLTSDGQLQLCLNSDRHYDLLSLLRGEATDTEIREKIIAAIEEKPASHRFYDEQTKSTENRTMNLIGG